MGRVRRAARPFNRQQDRASPGPILMSSSARSVDPPVGDQQVVEARVAGQSIPTREQLDSATAKLFDLH